MSFDIARGILYDAWIENFKKANPGNPGLAEQLCRGWVAGRKLSQSEIRLEVELNNASNLFTFGVTVNQANSSNVVFPTEVRLNLQDSLVAAEYAILVGNPSSRADTDFLLHTYGNTQNFTAAQASALDGEFYSNANYLLKVSGDVVAPSRGLFNNWYKPQTQQTAPLGAGSPGDQIRGAEDGFITQEPNLLLIGTKNYVPQIQLHTNFATDMGFTRAILIYRGILAQNSTSIN